MTDTTPPRTRTEIAHSRADSSAPRILLVDDQPERLLTYETILADLPVECVRALSGEEALQHLLHHQFAVILLDVKMPGMDGFEVARLIRAHPRFERMPIIFVTGIHLSQLDHLRGYAAGAIDYIPVPVIPEILRAKVAVLVELHQRRFELQAANRALHEAREQLEAQHRRTIADNEARLHAILEHPTDLTLVLEAERDAGGRICDWIYRLANTNALNLLGLSHDALVGRRLSELLPDRAEHTGALCMQALETREMVRYESRFKERDFLVTLFPSGADCVVSSGLDVTERKRTMAALRASEARYRALIENAPVAVAHNSLDGRFEYANRAFCTLVGFTQEELRQRTWQDITHPEDLSDDQLLADELLAGKIPHYTHEKRYVRKDGSHVWASVFGNFVLNDQGGPVQGIAVAVDITERKRVDLALREGEERFRELANHIDQLVWTCDEFGKATWYNSRWYEYTGSTPEDIQGDGWKKVHDPAHLERVVAHFGEALRTGQAWEDTFPLRGRDGRYRWFLSRAVPIRDDRGRVIRWFGSNTDVTQLRNLQEALEDADRRKDDFIAMLAHELRNPVAPIRNAAEALRQLVSGDERASVLVAMIERQGVQLARLLDDLLDVARITQGRIELRQQIVDIEACVEMALETAEPLIRAKRHRLTMTRAYAPLHVRADKVRLAQCLANLLDNAAKFTEDGGEIALRSFAEDGDVVVEIVDSGVGIPADTLPRIFDRFVKSDRTPHRSQDGLGLGLSICKQLAELHGGSISARSEGPGHGATFVLRLPRAEVSRPAMPAPSPVARSSQRVLIVDDNHDAADSLGHLLRLMGHRTQTAYSAEGALEHVTGFEPDVVLLDIGLPGIDGYELAQRIRAIAPAARLIALSGYGRAEDKRRTAAAGIDVHLVKPADLGAIEQALARG